ncbi:MAG: tRNA (guanosine(37)-N1)-methyltransferase TrmD [Sinobacterium sp.]|nr:tRNA (guanosine(37)-N1)-methyltransferase TrmD [Sinobacterium sp.]
MRFSVLSLLPEMFTALTASGVTSRAIKNELLSVDVVNPREFTTNRHRTVDGRPCGGGPGMVMMIEPLKQALLSVKAALPVDAHVPVVYLSPQGETFNQAKAQDLSKLEHVILIAGRYEGIDQRFIDNYVDEEISLGDFVVSGGELPAMMLMDAVARCVPGVLGHELSAEEDSFYKGLLDHPQYTKPNEYIGENGVEQVPDVLLGGNHEHIRRWRLKQALGRTWLRRPDLLEVRTLSKEELLLLAEFKQAHLES